MSDDTNDCQWIIDAFENAESITPDTIVQWDQSESASTESEPLKRWQPFPLETLPSRLRVFVIDASKSIGINAVNTAACVLSIISGIIGLTFRIEIKQGYSEPAMIWVVPIADSGFGKSPALDCARMPIDQLQIQAMDLYKTRKEQYDTDLDEYKR